MALSKHERIYFDELEPIKRINRQQRRLFNYCLLMKHNFRYYLVMCVSCALWFGVFITSYMYS